MLLFPEPSPRVGHGPHPHHGHKQGHHTVSPPPPPSAYLLFALLSAAVLCTRLGVVGYVCAYVYVCVCACMRGSLGGGGGGVHPQDLQRAVMKSL